MKKYSIIEILLSDRWQWIRRRSKHVWVKDVETTGHLWVKFSDQELKEHLSRGVDLLAVWKSTPGFILEDWRNL